MIYTNTFFTFHKHLIFRFSHTWPAGGRPTGLGIRRKNCNWEFAEILGSNHVFGSKLARMGRGATKTGRSVLKFPEEVQPRGPFGPKTAENLKTLIFCRPAGHLAGHYYYNGNTCNTLYY